MGNVPAVTPLGDQEKAEVDSALTSAIFVRSPRLARLLNYLCAKYFAGEADQIKEYNIAVDVLDRPPTFDPSADAIARVEIHRIRKKLREYYETEGTARPLRIIIPSGRYVPLFLQVAETTTDADGMAASLAESPQRQGVVASSAPLLTERFTASWRDLVKHRWIWTALVGLGLCSAIGYWFSRNRSVVAPQPLALSQPNSANPVISATPISVITVPPLAGVATPGLRILCGQRKPHSDRWGRLWSADEYFEGGEYWERPQTYLARTFDPSLFQGARLGTFSYQIPLNPGVYELHLYFAETTFGPPNTGGENSRVFHVVVDHKGRILSEFDVISDAGGPGIVDERVFKDISPGPDGLLKIRFMSVASQAMVSGIEIVPARPHRMNPIRLLAQDRSYKDANEHLWLPENYWMGGRPAARSGILETEDHEIYAKERYGNFSYAIPVGEGEYGVTLHLAEAFWGRENAGGGGVGSRVFDVFCNGAALIRDLDIYKEVGGDRPLVKTFHHLKPNAQGKLLFSFVPVRNYASLCAIEVEDESKL